MTRHDTPVLSYSLTDYCIDWWCSMLVSKVDKVIISSKWSRLYNCKLYVQLQS